MHCHKNIIVKKSTASAKIAVKKSRLYFVAGSHVGVIKNRSRDNNASRKRYVKALLWIFLAFACRNNDSLII